MSQMDAQMDALLLVLSVTPYEDRGTREALLAEMERITALAAGTQRAETNEDLAQSEGCQSGPKGNAQ